MDNFAIYRRDLKIPYYTIFDPETVNDMATFENPHRPSAGIEYVIVNGVVSLERGKVTGRLAGRPLRGPGYDAGSSSRP